MSTKLGLVPTTKADIAAANAFWAVQIKKIMGGERSSFGEDVPIEENGLVQAFARHRIAASAGLLPITLPGSWETPEGKEMAERYVGVARSTLCKGDVSDLALANAVFMAGRDDLDLMVWQTAAKARIRWLSAQLALALTLKSSAACALMYLQTGFLECTACGAEIPTKNLDAASELADVVEPASE